MERAGQQGLRPTLYPKRPVQFNHQFSMEESPPRSSPGEDTNRRRRAGSADMRSSRPLNPGVPNLPYQPGHPQYARPKIYSEPPLHNFQQKPSDSSYGAVRKGTDDLENHRAGPYAGPTYQSSGPVAYRTDGRFVQIEALTMWLGRWTVRGRFINIGEPRTYTNAKGEGKLWVMDLVDSAAPKGTIRCTLFNKAVDKFQSVIKEDEIFSVSRGQIRTKNAKFNLLPHEYEMQLGEDAEICWVAQDDPSIPSSRSCQPLTPISELENLTKNTMVSVCGVISDCSDITQVLTRTTGKSQDKREFTIVDRGLKTVNVTLWANKVNQIDSSMLGSVVLIENARVDEYNGRRLSSSYETAIKVDPPVAAVEELRNWFVTEGKFQRESFQSLGGREANRSDAPRLTITQIKERVSTVSEKELEDKGAWFSCRATLMHITQERYFWVACPNCGRKVVPSENAYDEYGIDQQQPAGGSICRNCDKDVNPVRKYLLNVEIADSGGSLACVAIGDRGTQFMGGIEADTLGELDFNPRCDKRTTDFFADRIGRLYAFRVNAKAEHYRDEMSVKYRIFNADALSGEEEDEQKIMKTHELVVKDAKSSMDWIKEKLAFD